MPFRLANDPPVLFRIGRRPDPLTWPPLAFSGEGRYDDPTRRQSTLYAASQKRTIFLETLDKFRPKVSLLSRLNETPETWGWKATGAPRQPHADITGIITPDYFRRLIATFAVESNQRWLDLKSLETHEFLRRHLSSELANLGLANRFVLGDLLAHDHNVTQIIAGWAIDNGFSGVAYASCHDPSLTCWALFEGALIRQVDEPQAIDSDDPDLLAVAKLWHLQIPEAGRDQPS